MWRDASQPREQGAALVLALLVTLLVVSLGLAALAMATTQLRLAANQRDGTVALNAAEAGLNRAVDLLAQGQDLPPDGLGPEELVPGVTYKVSVEWESKGEKQGVLRLTAEGLAGRARRAVVARVSVEGKKNARVRLLSWQEGD
ncbi:MAG: PilX N-terminal domain-containing pilus assembly protein [Firmicutes bacterium]|nr:PilX N-terminal domain-containing pilus assembly protein [Bacillota bacterium]